MKRLFLLFFISSNFLFAQKSTFIIGKVLDKNQQPIENVTVSHLYEGVETNAKGEYVLKVKNNDTITVSFRHISYIPISKQLFIKNQDSVQLPHIILSQKIESINEVIIIDTSSEVSNSTEIKMNEVEKIPSIQQGAESILMTLPGVNNNNELSNQYNVRGGNFDENLVYVNGIEIYRPFLIRSGQQEGLSFVNSNMVQNIRFSAGGFEAKYGDKMSSVLDITYKKPSENKTKVNLNLMGASITNEGTFFNNKLTSITGIRYRDNSMFINGADTETNARPTFFDAQTLISLRLSNKISFNFLGNYTENIYNFIPLTRVTKFGSITNPLQLIVFYNGQEKDTYQTVFGAINTIYKPNDTFKFELTNSIYHTVEEEYFDIEANYNLGEINSDFSSDSFGDVSYYSGIGSQINHARNDLDALISSFHLKGIYTKNNTKIESGIRIKNEDIKDRINEWEVIDSLGFNVRPPGFNSINQPYEPFIGEIIPYQSVNNSNNIKINRIEWFGQYSNFSTLNNSKLWYKIGVRSHFWNAENKITQLKSNQQTHSVRAQLAIEPNWNRKMLFRIAAGMYNQPPFYRELRNFSGEVQLNVEEQKSIHYIFGNDYSFTMWNRPFKLTTDLYYKHLTNVNTYSIDNVRIRYVANNNAKAYSTGIDIRLNGEFVPGTQSWISLGLMKSEENSEDRGYIARPTDQRFKFAMLFQDYVPSIPNIKMYLNLVFNSGLPGGAPSYSDPYQFQRRLDSYKRADIGISYVFKDKNQGQNTVLFKNINQLALGFEIFNVFDVKNSITNTWVRDAYSKNFYGIPNYMTQRIFNVTLDVSF